jgi:glycosyltransferase involved in cell wall biosynthesis
VTTVLSAPAIRPSQHTQRHASLRDVCDGVICFGGEDYWYHNRGHYDMQMMREAASGDHAVPVLYVNSIGMRTPRLGEGRMFLTRVRRKLRSLRRGRIKVRPNFTVFSPAVAPGRLGRMLTGWSLAGQVRRAARSCGITRPLVWVACPPAAAAAAKLAPAALVYQRTDRFEAFPNVDRDGIAAADRRLKRQADLTLFCSRLLYEAEHDECRRAAYVDHGVDYDRFYSAGRASTASIESRACALVSEGASEGGPDDVRAIPHPRIGFIGGIDIHTFDPTLFVEVARRLPDLQFVLVGGCSLPAGWTGDLPNVHLLGQKPYDDVPAYMAACDVLIMPWNQGEWIKACNPVKLKEYLAVGRPIVTTPFDELRRYDGLVRTAADHAAFAAEIRSALQEPDAPGLEAGRRRVSDETWAAKAAAVARLLSEKERVE